MGVALGEKTSREYLDLEPGQVQQAGLGKLAGRSPWLAARRGSFTFNRFVTVFVTIGGRLGEIVW